MIRVAFLGTGLLGEPMARRILAGGYHLTVYNRTPEKTRGLAELGAVVAVTPLEAIASAEVFITMLTDFPAIQALLLNLPEISFTGKTWIQMGTIAPIESVALQETMEGKGGDYLEAPVLGSIPQADAGALFILFGGKSEQLTRWMPLLSTMGKNITMFGEIGKASAAKLAFNQLIASLTTSFALSLGYLQEHQIDVEAFMGILRESALYAPTFDKKLPLMLSRDFTRANFPVKHLLKDIALIHRDFAATGLFTAPLAGVEELLKLAIAQGAANLDYSALFNTVYPAREEKARGKKMETENKD